MFKTANIKLTGPNKTATWRFIIEVGTSLQREINLGDEELNAPQSPIQCKIGEVTLSVGENFFYGGTYWNILEFTDVRVPSVYDDSGVPLIKCKALEDCERFRKAHEIVLPADRVAELIELTRSLDQFTLIAD